MSTEVLPRAPRGPVVALYDVATQTLHKLSSFKADRITLGRARSCDIRFFDPSVSLLHCEIVREGSERYLIDCLSDNGTYIYHDVPIQRVVLVPGMPIRMGRVEVYAFGVEEQVAIMARSVTSFLARAHDVYGSSRRAAARVHRSRMTVLRAKRRRAAGIIGGG